MSKREHKHATNAREMIGTSKTQRKTARKSPKTRGNADQNAKHTRENARNHEEMRIKNAENTHPAILRVWLAGGEQPL